MPKWTCSSCKASMTVKSSHIGTRQACPACKNVEEVEEATVLQSVTPVPRSVVKTVAIPTGQIVRESPPLIKIIKIVHAVGSVLWSGLFIWMASYYEFSAFYLGVVLVGMVYAACWLFYEFYSDLYRCRRLLEEIAKK